MNAAILRRLAALELDGKAMSEVLSIIADIQGASDERKAKDRDRKRNVRGNSVENPETFHGNSAGLKKEIPPIPPKEKNYTHTREATPAETYADRIRGVFAMASVACPDLNPSIAWRKAEWPIEIVCETIRARLAAAGTRRISTLNFFTGAIADAVANASAPVPVGRANQRAGPAPTARQSAESLLRQSLGIGEFANVSGNDFQATSATGPVIEADAYRFGDSP